jgi:hypothetical protein
LAEHFADFVVETVLDGQILLNDGRDKSRRDLGIVVSIHWGVSFLTIWRET